MIVGLDLATRCTGWAAGDGAERPRVGAWTYDYVGADLAALLEAFEADMDRLESAFGTPKALIYESPLLLPHDRLLPLRKVYALGAYLELWCKRRGVVVEEASAVSLKKLLTGNHKAKKDDMVAMCRRLQISLPEGEKSKDAADAVAAWLCGVHHHAREHQPMWDRMIYSPRGRLL